MTSPSVRLRASARKTSGQASVELLATAPLLVLVALAAAHVIAAFACREVAAHAAQAGAVAVIQGADPERAARAALPGWSRAAVRVAAGGRRVVVEVRPPAIVPGLETFVRARAEADAGPSR